MIWSLAHTHTLATSQAFDHHLINKLNESKEWRVKENQHTHARTQLYCWIRSEINEKINTFWHLRYFFLNIDCWCNPFTWTIENKIDFFFQVASIRLYCCWEFNKLFNSHFNNRQNYGSETNRFCRNKSFKFNTFMVMVMEMLLYMIIEFQFTPDEFFIEFGNRIEF